MIGNGEGVVWVLGVGVDEAKRRGVFCPLFVMHLRYGKAKHRWKCLLIVCFMGIVELKLSPKVRKPKWKSGVKSAQMRKCSDIFCEFKCKSGIYLN